MYAARLDAAVPLAEAVVLPPAFVADAVAALEAGQATNKDSLHQLKQRLARAHGTRLPRDADLAAALPASVAARFAPLLRQKPMRTQSGVAIVAVMSSPAHCPHGKCVYCPGGPEVDAPQSYTGFEPSTMRARRFQYQAYRIVRHRLGQLSRNGHATDKVDIVVQGGTFPARDAAYRDWFITAIYAGLNDGPCPGDDADSCCGFDDESTWQAMDGADRDARLQAAKRLNEAAGARCIGLTIETKPDWCLEEHVDEMLRYGATRVELGVQTLDEEVLALTHRGHDLQATRDSLRVAKDAGLKICAHMMPGQPRPREPREGLARPAVDRQADGTAGQPRREDLLGGAAVGRQADGAAGQPRREDLLDGAAVGREADGAAGQAPLEGDPTTFHPNAVADLEDMRRLFAEPDWRPDMLKIYPTLVVMDGETTLKKWWREGRFEALETANATTLVGEAKGFVPEWCRIQRIDRDIPTTHVEAGVMNTNLRQMAQAWRAKQGLPSCRCLRCREAGTRQREGAKLDAERIVLVRRDYEASCGTETFLSLEDPEADAVVAYLRLRRVTPEQAPHRAEVQHPDGVAVVREVKVPGVAQPIGFHDAADGGGSGGWQHRGHGSRLLAEAERIASDEWSVGKVLVIAGVGVKEYYRDRGYSDDGAYVAKLTAGR